MPRNSQQETLKMIRSETKKRLHNNKLEKTQREALFQQFSSLMPQFYPAAPQSSPNLDAHEGSEDDLPPVCLPENRFTSSEKMPGATSTSSDSTESTPRQIEVPADLSLENAVKTLDMTEKKEALSLPLSALISRLTAYQNQPEKNFWFMKESRQLNRKINQALAGEIATQIQNRQGITWDAIMRSRQDVTRKVLEANPTQAKFYQARSIHSQTLNGLLKEAQAALPLSVDEQVSILKTKLNQYIARASKGESFTFFNASRQASRQVNVALAKHFLTSLDTFSIKAVFNPDLIQQVRNDFAELANNSNYTDRGIQSKELHDIIKLAHQFSGEAEVTAGLGFSM